MLLKNVSWVVFAFLAISIGLYPLIYYFVDMHDKGLLATKTQDLLLNYYWKTFFYIHITGGGIALITGWTQFNKKLRDKYLSIHRNVGKIYVVSVLFSSSAGLFIAFFSTGGLVTHFGFGSLAVLWLLTTLRAYTAVRKKNLEEHEKFMIRSYALCFAAVTLRLWIPLFQFVLHQEFIRSYQIISWLCWVPNLALAEFIIASKKRQIKPQPVTTF